MTLCGSGTEIRMWNYCDTSDRARAVQIEDLELYFSYETLIAFRSNKSGLVIRENNWSVTTGKHLNAVNPDHSIRISDKYFNEELEALLRHLGLKGLDEIVA